MGHAMEKVHANVEGVVAKAAERVQANIAIEYLHIAVHYPLKIKIANGNKESSCDDNRN